VAKHAIDCHLKPGIAHLGFSARETAREHAYADYLAESYGYRHLEKLGPDEARALCPSPEYAGGTLDMGAAHLHPLGLVLGLARAASEQGNPVWGPLMRAGVDKSLFARQVEKYADVYTSRVSNFATATPYGYLRAARGSLPHDHAHR